MSYQLVSFANGGSVADVKYIYDPITQKGTYSLVQYDGLFRRSNDGVTWSDENDYAPLEDPAVTGAYKLAFGAGKYVAALASKAYVYTEPTTGTPTGSWDDTTYTNETLNLLHGSGNLALHVTDATSGGVTFSQFRTLTPSGWSLPHVFDYYTDTANYTFSSGLQNTRVIDVTALSSGLYAALVRKVNLQNTYVNGTTTTTSTTTTTTTATTTTSTTTTTTLVYPYNKSEYAVKIFSVSDAGAVTVLYTLAFDADDYELDLVGKEDQLKLVQVRNYLYITAPNAVLSTKLTTLTSASQLVKVAGTGLPTFVNVSNAATNGRVLLVLDDRDSETDKLYTYNPSTRIWTEVNLYQSARRPTPEVVDLSIIDYSNGQVYILDGESDLYRSTTLASWSYVQNLVIRDTDSSDVFFVNNRPFLTGEILGLGYLIIKERVTKSLPTFVPKCN